MKDVKVIKNNVGAIIGKVTGESLRKAAFAGGQVVEANAKINVNKTFSANSTGGAGLSGSIQTVLSKATMKRAEVDVGPTVVYGRIRELGGLISTVKAKMLSWLLDSGTGLANKQKAEGIVFVAKGADGVERVFAEAVQVYPSPYLRPALEENLPSIVKAVSYQLKKGIESVAK